MNRKKKQNIKNLKNNNHGNKNQICILRYAYFIRY